MGTIISRFAEKSTEKSSDETTCISITAETYKCIDISAFVPQCITITSNVPTSELYQEQYDRDDVEITDAPILEIILINNEAPVLNVNLDSGGMVYVTDFDTVYIKITNYDTNVEYVNLFSNEDGWYDAVVYLDEAEERIVWALDDYAFEGTQMWFYAQAKASDKLISPQANVTVMQMEQTDQPNLSSWVSQYENTVLNITILDYDATYTYSEPIVTGGTAVRTGNIIAWTLPKVTSDTHHEISITATAPLMYESLPGVSGGIVENAFVRQDIYTVRPETPSVTILFKGFAAYPNAVVTPRWSYWYSGGGAAWSICHLCIDGTNHFTLAIDNDVGFDVRLTTQVSNPLSPYFRHFCQPFTYCALLEINFIDGKIYYDGVKKDLVKWNKFPEPDQSCL